jgi:hypothetical protein
MSDTYIDYNEMEIYGNYTIAALPLLEGQNPGVTALKQQLQKHIDTVREAKGLKRGTTEGSDGKREDRNALQARTGRSLSSIKSHLDGINKDEDGPDLDLSLFFEGGRLGDLSKSTPAQTLLKAEYTLQGFSKSPDFPLKDDKEKKLTALVRDLKAALEQSSSARPEEANVSTELQQAGDNWRREYRGLKWVVWGLLIQAKREREYSSYFKDETASSGHSASEVAPSVTPTTSPEPTKPA